MKISFVGGGAMAEAILGGILEAEIAGLHAGILTEAVGERSIERAAELRRSADGQIAARDVDGLEATAESFRQVRAQLGAEYEIVIFGGAWRRHDDIPGGRNHYLLVQAIDAADRQDEGGDRMG